MQDPARGVIELAGDDGTVRRKLALPRELQFANVIACPSDGSLLLLHTLAHFSSGGVSRPPGQIVRVDSSGQDEVVDSFSGTDYFVSQSDKIFVEQPLGRLVMAAASDSEVFIGASDDARIHVLPLLRGKARELAVPLAKHTAVASDLLEAITLRIASAPLSETREKLRVAIVQSPLRPSELLYDALVVDRPGNLWLRTFETPRRTTIRWKVLTRDGVTIANCDIPANVSVTDIGDDYLIGIERSISSAPEHAVRYQLIKAKE